MSTIKTDICYQWANRWINLWKKKFAQFNNNETVIGYASGVYCISLNRCYHCAQFWKSLKQKYKSLITGDHLDADKFPIKITIKQSQSGVLFNYLVQLIMPKHSKEKQRKKLEIHQQNFQQLKSAYSNKWTFIISRNEAAFKQMLWIQICHGISMQRNIVAEAQIYAR